MEIIIAVSSASWFVVKDNMFMKLCWTSQVLYKFYLIQENNIKICFFFFPDDLYNSLIKNCLCHIFFRITDHPETFKWQPRHRLLNITEARMVEN